MINRIYIENFKTIRKLELDLNNDINIIVGDNETGKTTLLEAITMVLTGQLHGRYIPLEISPYLFNKDVVEDYISKIRAKAFVEPPEIIVELYLDETPDTAKFKGTNNKRRENTVGIFIKIGFDDDYKEEYSNYIENPESISSVPAEYYKVSWYSFAHSSITKRSIPINTTLIDTTTIRLQNRTDYYIQEIIGDCLTPKERTHLALSYRSLKETFAKNDSLNRINKELKEEQGKISEKDLSVSIDISQRTSWETNLTSYLDDIPFQFIGKGDQNILKTLLALERKADNTQIILIEEPENHLSYSNMSKLIKMINDKCAEKQVFVSTHSTFVSNKLGLDKTILLGRSLNTATLKDLSPDTKKYFKKLPGYDTLRLIIAEKAILVEGPSDELIIQKAYMQMYHKLPIQDGIDVITVRGVSFKRFLEIAKLTRSEVIVITDNDGDYQKNIIDKYTEYIDLPNVKICYDKDNDAHTLEYQIVKCNSLELLQNVLNCSYSSRKEIAEYMVKNKTESALKIFDSDLTIDIPEYIKESING